MSEPAIDLESPLSALEEPSIAAPPEPEPPPVEATPPEPPKAQAPPVEDVDGIKGALIAERRRRQELEEENRALRQPPPQPKPDIPSVSDEEAERYARRYELFTATGPDIARAKQIIADNRSEIARVAKEAAQQAVAPLEDNSARQAAREQFLRVATVKDAGGQTFLLDETGQRALAEKFAGMPPQLAAIPAVADLMLNAVLGETMRTRKTGPAPPSREPVLTEPAGGPRNPAYTISNLEKKVAESRGISTQDWEKHAKGYQPGVPNRLD